MKRVTITITALFPDDADVSDDDIHSVATDAAVQVQEPELLVDGERLPLPSPTSVQTEVSITNE